MPPEKTDRLAKLYQAGEPEAAEPAVEDVTAAQSELATCGTRSGGKGVQAPRQHFLHAPDSMGGDFLTPPVFLESGGGLVSTASDYLRFAQMLVSTLFTCANGLLASSCRYRLTCLEQPARVHSLTVASLMASVSCRAKS